jgi:ElaB/YqjD/DUF883 family membrane-anchored ribosome-binding protein
MSETDPALLAAEAQVEAARSRLFETLGEVQDRLSPSNFAQDAMDKATEGLASVARKGGEVVRARPAAVAAVAGTVGLVLARGWIAKLFKRRKHETASAADGLTSEETRPVTSGEKGPLS